MEEVHVARESIFGRGTGAETLQKSLSFLRRPASTDVLPVTYFVEEFQVSSIPGVALTPPASL
jgi:hypothetical protein